MGLYWNASKSLPRGLIVGARRAQRPDRGRPPRLPRVLPVQREALAQDDAGDAAAFAGDVPHAYVAAGAQPVRFSLAVSEPGAGRRSRSESSNA